VSAVAAVAVDLRQAPARRRAQNLDDHWTTSLALFLRKRLRFQARCQLPDKSSGRALIAIAGMLSLARRKRRTGSVSPVVPAGALAGARAPSPTTAAPAHGARGHCGDVTNATANLGRDTGRYRSGALAAILCRGFRMDARFREPGNRLLPDERVHARHV